jgi:UDP-glucose 4-epimerase
LKVLIAGGAGFIGSTVASACLDNGITPVILDDLSTGRAEFVRERIFYQGDIADGSLIIRIFAEHPDIDVAVHCAALIVVPESMDDPLRYYRENVGKSLDFLGHLIANRCGRLLFSSSAAIYQPGGGLAVDESSPVGPANPYARTKAMFEEILRDSSRAHLVRAISLRYFNPIGADPTMRTGMQRAQPSHVLGRIIDAARCGGMFWLTGADWPTRDGSGVRDYIHVWDLARAHVCAIERFDHIVPPDSGQRYEAINLGTGNGTTVIELLTAFVAVTGRKIEVRVAPRRPGDTAGVYTQSVRAQQLLGWRPSLSIEDGIRHSLQWVTVRDNVLDCAGNGAPSTTRPLPSRCILPRRERRRLTPARRRAPAIPERQPSVVRVVARRQGYDLADRRPMAASERSARL